MKNTSAYAVLTRFGIIAAVVATLVLIAPAASAQPDCKLDGSTVKCTYKENGTGPVANFSATDDEGDAFTWSLKEEDDYKKFSISNAGVLTFKSPPDFESPGDGGKDNVYNVTVKASDGERAVEVTVTGVNEPGVVKFTGNQQPQAGRSMTATFEDEDGSTVNARWQWSKSEDKDAADEDWEDVGKASSSYTPGDADIGSYLRATVSYTDVTYGARDTVSGVTLYTVEERPSANAPPKISTSPIEVLEGVDGTIGTIVGDDPNNDELNYRLWATGDDTVSSDTDSDTTVDSADNDNDRFTITESGELKLKAKLDFEQADDPLDTVTDISGTTDIVEYTVVVTAIDPSGAKGSGAVIIHLLNVDEAPTVTASGTDVSDNAVSVEERQRAAPSITFTAGDDPEGETVAPADSTDTPWTLEGADASRFQIAAGVVTFDDDFTPNFESPKDADKNNKYEVTVVVPVADSEVPGKRSVTVTVTDVNDPGTAKVSKREPQVGTVVSATLTDEDADIERRAWQWYRGGDSDDTATDLSGATDCSSTNAPSTTNPCEIDGQTSPTYSVSSADEDHLLQVLVSYRDKFTDTDADPVVPHTAVGRPARPVQAIPAANTAPKFGVPDPVIDGDETEHVMREVDENEKETVGMFTATDGDLLDYELGGADKALFSLSTPSGTSNEVTLSMKEALDFENPKDADGNNAYEVSITAEDPSGAADTIMVTLTVKNVNDAATISLATAQSASECELDGSTVKCTYKENGTDPVASFSAVDDEGDAYTWSLKEVDDYKKFSISNAGVLTFKSPPDFESPGDGGKDNVYNVTVKASDGERAVEVTVTGVNEPGVVKFTGNQQPQAGRSMTATFEDEDGSTVNARWQWSKSEDKDAADEDWEDVGKASSSYTPGDADIGSYLRATVSYTDVTYGARDTVSGVTLYTVEERPSANAPPKISTSPIEVLEGVDGTIGTIVGDDPNNDELNYRLWATGDDTVSSDTDSDTTVDSADNDNDRFTITESGELKLKAKLDFEQADDPLDTVTDISGTTDIVEYTVVVTAIDPSGAKGSGAVIIHLLNVDEAPTVTASGTDVSDNAVSVEERQRAAPSITFTAGDDPEGETVAPADSTDTPWTLEGADASRFQIAAGVVTFDDDFTPNFESPKDADKNNKYEVTVVVPVADSEVPGKRSVTVTVTDVNDPGTAKVSKREPQVGTVVSATLTDEDADIERRAWQWYRGGDSDDTATDLSGATDCSSTNAPSTTNPCEIDGQTSPTYSVSSADEDHLLQVLVSYRDKFTDTDADPVVPHTAVGRPARPVQAIPAANTAPKFGVPDPVIDGDETEHVMREVDENEKETVGMFTATDGDLLDYELGGADKALFSLSTPSGTSNEVTLSMKEALDFENPKDADGNNAYEVSITATDPSGAKDTIMVTLTVKNVNDAAAIALNYEPAFDAETDEREIAENSEAGAAVGDPVVATDENGDADTLTYSLDEMGDMYFDIGSSTGQITVGEGTMLDYESETKSYSVTVTVMDRGGLSDTVAVTITVTDVNDAPMFDAETAEREIAENSEAGTAVGDPVTAMDQDDGDELTYSLDEMGDMSFDIDADTGQITVGEGAMLDYETATSHEVTVTASDGDGETASIAVTIMVTDVPESPCVTGGAVEADGALAADCETLLGIMDDLVGEDGTAELNWSDDLAIGDWDGVASGTGRVTGIYLRGAGLAGVLPADIANLDALTRLTLTDNDLTGEIPDLNGLDSIQWLVLGGNAFTGSIPASLGNLDSLIRLWLHRNEGGFEGGIPAELGSLSNLRYLMLHGNGLTGEIPAELGMANNLKALYLYGNSLSGSIPAELGNLVDAKGESVRLVYLHNNMLTGDVPAELGNLVSLRVKTDTTTGGLRLSGNMLTGCIPAAIFPAAHDAEAAGLMACADDGNGNGNGES